MAAAEAGGMWQQTAAKCHMVHKDTIQSPKVVSLPRIISRSPTDSCHPTGYSYYWSNNCFSPETKLDLQVELSPITHKDDHFELEESLNVRFSKPAGLQSLAVESTNTMKSSPQLISAISDYSAAELEFEWQFRIDPQHKSGPTTCMCEPCKEEEGVTFKEAIWCDGKRDRPKRLQQEQEFGSSKVTAENNHDGGSLASPHYGGFLSRQQLFASNVGAIFQEISEDQNKSSRSSMKSVLWQVADEDNLARQVTQNNEECLDNCDFCFPQGRLTTKSTIPTCDCSLSMGKQQDVLQNPDENVLSSLPMHEFMHLESKGHLGSYPSLGKLDPNSIEPWESQRLFNPQTIPFVNGIPIRQGSHSFSSSSRYSQFNEGHVVNMDQGSVLFAEALCHSQTRAREAEKKVQQAFEEKERMMHLFFKEAYLAFTYRQWVTSLQSENMWLRMTPQHQPVTSLEHSVFNPFSALERLSSKHWNFFGHSCKVGYHREQSDQNLLAMWHEKALVYLGDPNEIMIGCTLAFALGLSLAGAGLVLGWSMGWILLSY
ncbi:unnamed protein product [Calypogeia fissa]